MEISKQESNDFFSKNISSEPEIQEDSPHNSEYPFVLYSAEELLNKDIPEIEWFIPDMITKMGTTFIAGDTGSYKSGMALYLALSTTTKCAFLKYNTIPKLRVLYIDEEMGLSKIKTRLIQLKNGLGIDKPLDNLFFASFNNIKLDDSRTYDWDILLDRTQPNIIILDSLVRFMSGDENSAMDAKKCFDIIKYVITKYKASFLILHHMRKNGGNSKSDMRGSGDFAAFADNVFICTKKARDVFELKQVKSRHNSEEMLFKIRIQHVGTDSIRIVLDSSEKVAQLSKMAECISDMSSWMTNRKEFTTKEFNNELGKKHARNTLFSTLNEMKKLKEITQTAHGKYRVNKNNNIINTESICPEKNNTITQKEELFNSLDEQDYSTKLLN